MTQTLLQPVTRTLEFWGKDGKATGPTKAYPMARYEYQTGELVKDFGSMSVWKYPTDLSGALPDYWLSYHRKDGSHGGGGFYRTEEAAFKAVEDTLVMREYDEKKREINRLHQAALAALDGEYKGRI